MKKILLIAVSVAVLNTLKAQKIENEIFKNSDLIYIPDENKTYFSEEIIESEDSEGNDQIELVGVKGNIRGNYIELLNRIEPSLRPIVKKDKHRKDVNPLPNTHLITCVLGGNVCVIILKKNQFPQ